jgi:hypothetical protein
MAVGIVAGSVHDVGVLNSQKVEDQDVAREGTVLLQVQPSDVVALNDGHGRIVGLEVVAGTPPGGAPGGQDIADAFVEAIVGDDDQAEIARLVDGELGSGPGIEALMKIVSDAEIARGKPASFPGSFRYAVRANGWTGSLEVYTDDSGHVWRYALRRSFVQ